MIITSSHILITRVLDYVERTGEDMFFNSAARELKSIQFEDGVAKLITRSNETEAIKPTIEGCLWGIRTLTQILNHCPRDWIQFVKRAQDWLLLYLRKN